MMAAEELQAGAADFLAGTRVLFVEARYGSLRQVVQALKHLGVPCEAVCGPGEANTTLETDVGLCLGVTDLSDPGVILQELRYRFPALPWIEVPRAPHPAAAELARNISDRLKDHPYDVEVVDVIGRALASQWGSFGDVRSTHYLRRDGRVPETVCATVEVAGRGVWGRVAFAASEQVLYRQYRRSCGEEPVRADDVYDVAAEFANRLTGVIRRHYRLLGVPSTQSAPSTVVGRDLYQRPIADTPALMVEHRSITGDVIYVEWQLGTKPVGSAPPPYGQLPTGEPVYL